MRHVFPAAGIAPGPIGGTAGMTKLAPGKLDDIAKEVPLGRLGKTSDIALACVYLARSLSSAIPRRRTFALPHTSLPPGLSTAISSSALALWRACLLFVL